MLLQIAKAHFAHLAGTVCTRSGVIDDPVVGLGIEERSPDEHHHVVRLLLFGLMEIQQVAWLGRADVAAERARIQADQRSRVGEFGRSARGRRATRGRAASRSRQVSGQNGRQGMSA